MSKEPLPNKELFDMTTLEDFNCRDGAYTGEDNDELDVREPQSTGWGVCSLCGEQAYLFGHMVVDVDDDNVVDESDVCCECVTGLIEEVMNNSQSGDDN